jgi:hypothetical protein
VTDVNDSMVRCFTSLRHARSLAIGIWGQGAAELRSEISMLVDKNACVPFDS